MSLKKLQNPAQPPRVRVKIRLTRLNKELRPKRSRKRLGRKRKDGDTKENKIDKKDEMVAPPQYRLIPLKP